MFVCLLSFIIISLNVTLKMNLNITIGSNNCQLCQRRIIPWLILMVGSGAGNGKLPRSQAELIIINGHQCNYGNNLFRTLQFFYVSFALCNEVIKPMQCPASKMHFSQMIFSALLILVSWTWTLPSPETATKGGKRADRFSPTL